MAKLQRKRRPALTPDSGSLAATAYERIKRAILSARLRGGDYINVAQLCDELQLGRSPVHQAVHRLALEGLVEILPRKGVVIRANSFEDFIQISEARALLAPALAGMAARRADGQVIGRLERILLAVKASRTLRERDVLLTADLAFHGELFAASGNAPLAQMATRTHERAVRLLYGVQQSTQQLATTIALLQPVLLAIRNGDEAGAQVAMNRHVEASSFGPHLKSGARSAVA
jgi:DNA-binding GntR family transcriptional regulator